MLADGVGAGGEQAVDRVLFVLLLLPHHGGNSRFIALDRRLECLQIGILLLQLGFQIHNRLHGVLVLGKLLSVIALYLCDIICGI